MRAAIVGAGSVGAVVATRLAASGHEVTLVARGAHLEAIRQRGLQLIDATDGERASTVRARAVAEPEQVSPQDVVFLCVKQHDLAALLPRIAPMLGADAPVVPAINGVPWWYFHAIAGPDRDRPVRAIDPSGSMLAALDARRIVGCVVYLAAEIRGPGVVRLTASGPFVLGEPAGAAQPRTRALADTLAAAGMRAQVVDDVRLAIWTKLIGNLSFNPVAAITGMRTDELLADAGALEVIAAMMEEGRAVAFALGREVEVSTAQRIEMAKAIGNSRPSTLQDFESGRRPELEGLLGAVIELGEHVGVPVPTCRHVYQLARARARKLALLGER